jgi:hypothetical protein
MAIFFGILATLLITGSLGSTFSDKSQLPYHHTSENVTDIVNKVTEIVANAPAAIIPDTVSQEVAVSILNPALLQTLANISNNQLNFPFQPASSAADDLQKAIKEKEIVAAIMRGDVAMAASEYRNSANTDSEAIVDNALETSSGTKWLSLLKFINYLPKLPEKTKFLNSAFRLLNTPHESITFGCFVKLQMDSPAFRDASDDEKAALIVVQLKLPDFVRDMFWSSVCIRNVFFDELMSAETSEPFMKRRRVFTENVKLWSYRWQFEENNECESFLIKNVVGEHEYLYAADDGLAFDERRRRVYTWLPGGIVLHSDWILEPLKNSTNFNIKNTQRNEYLYAAVGDYAFSQYKRQVFTWIPGDVDAQGEWKLERCTRKTEEITSKIGRI